MLFVAQLKVIPGQLEEATRLFKHPKLPNNVMVHEFLALLGKPDAMVIFEAQDPVTAADFGPRCGSSGRKSTRAADGGGGAGGGCGKGGAAWPGGSITGAVAPFSEIRA